ncbi:MAG: CpsD/CapB family tyrosine-protein kinase [Proteobacteria bacterium]|nr:CpsD/CapB family tyrosine-protein kinase [Desulfobulbaceae bacterium]MBU4153661.1 CpsD/CapB family tyrosine-protein kinase [Pseudomonadota bacterium]
MGKVFKALHKALGDEHQDSVPVSERMAHEEVHLPGERSSESAATTVEPHIPAVKAQEGHAHVTPSHQAITGVDGWDEKLKAFSEPFSPLAENFRLLRTQILHPPSGSPLRKILITSTVPGVGKSFVCANLGVSLAQGLDQHALMVDCDLRRSRLATLFNVNGTRGLVNYLQQGEDLGGLIVKTGMRKLSLIPSGPRPANPAELLGSAKVEAMFAELESRYDDRFILIDTPPSVVASETAVLAKHVDGVILVVRWGMGDRETIKQLVESLGAEKIIGVVFNGYQANKLSAKMSGYDEYGYYAAGYAEYSTKG